MYCVQFRMCKWNANEPVCSSNIMVVELITSNISLMQRNRCSCYFELGEYEKAMEAITQSKEHDDQSSQCHFLAFRIALVTNNEQAGLCI